MAEFDCDRNRLTLKLAYYGPTRSGKTTNLTALYDILNPAYKSEVMLLETKDDRTLFFDLFPVGFRAPSGLLIKLQLFTVPGQVVHDTTRRTVLTRSDGIIFVADSQASQNDSNTESFKNMEENIKRIGLDFTSLPIVVQFNKQDLQNILSRENILQYWGKKPWPVVFSCATQNKGVVESFFLLLKLLYRAIDSKYKLTIEHGLNEEAFCENIINFTPDNDN